MLRWKRCIMLTFISGAAFAAPEINVEHKESLPDLGSQAAQQEEQTNKGKSLKSVVPITSLTPPRKGLKT